MKALRYSIIALLFSFSSPAFGQLVYPEATNHCYLDQFILETDSLVAKLDKVKIAEAITTGWDDKFTKKTEGVLGIQILVDNRGNSCLVSYRNDTNQKVKKMNLENNINEHLKWPRQSRKVSAIVVVEFDKGEITIRRMGTKDNVNLIELDN